MWQSKFWYQIVERCQQIWMKKYLELYWILLYASVCCFNHPFRTWMASTDINGPNRLDVRDSRIIVQTCFFHCHIRKKKCPVSIPKILQYWAIHCEPHSPPKWWFVIQARQTVGFRINQPKLGQVDTSPAWHRPPPGKLAAGCNKDRL